MGIIYVKFSEDISFLVVHNLDEGAEARIVSSPNKTDDNLTQIHLILSKV